MIWDAANARARGLATHFLAREDLVRAARTRSLPELGVRLSEAGYRVSDGLSASPADLDRRIGHTVGARYRLLGRWLGAGQAVLAVVMEDEDRRAIRSLLRGAAQGVSPGARLRGVNPTPTLGERVLERLAGAASPAALAAALVRAGHPAGRVLEAALADPHLAKLGLLGLEAALSRLFATRAARAARSGGRIVRAFVEQALDLENSWTLLASSGWGKDVAADDLYLPGGRLVTRQWYGQMAADRDPVRMLEALRTRFAGGPLASVFDGESRDPGTLERRALAAQIAWFRVEARRNPLSAAVVLGVILRIRAEARDLRALLAGIGLGAPPPVIEAAWAGAA